MQVSYNSSAIYIAATNDFDVYFVTHGSSNETSLTLNSSFTEFTNEQWRREFTSRTVTFGDLYLSIDDQASWINMTNTTGLPTNKDKLPTDYELPLVSDLPLDRIMFNLTEWVNVGNTSLRDRDSDLKDIPVYAHVVKGYGKNVPTRNRVQISLSFLLVVIACNAVKLCTMVWVLYMERSDFIVTLGDGVASFLEHPDPGTEKYCVFDKHAIVAEVAHRKLKREATLASVTKEDGSIVSFGSKFDHFEELVLDSSGVWRDQTHRYSSALGKDREVGSSFMYENCTNPNRFSLTDQCRFVVIVSSLIICLILVINLGQGKMDTAWGTLSRTILGAGDGSGNILLVAWIANSPQVVLSFCYFAMNSECTSMVGFWAMFS